MFEQQPEDGPRGGNPSRAAGGLLLRGLRPASVFNVLADAPEHAVILSRFEGAWWHLLDDGRFFLEPSRLNDPLSNLYVLQGVYETEGGAFVLHAESYRRNGELLALEGVIRAVGGRYALDCLYFHEGSLSPIRRLTQELTAEDARGMLGYTQTVKSIPTPALYDIELTGSTTAGDFGRVQACLYTVATSADLSAVEPDDVHLSVGDGSVPDAAVGRNGSCTFLPPLRTFADAARGALPGARRFDPDVRDGRVVLSASDIPAYQPIFSWREEEASAPDAEGRTRLTEMFLDARSLSFECRFEGEGVTGTIRAEGATFLGRAGRYEATFAGRRAEDVPQPAERLESKALLQTAGRDWHDTHVFEGEWQSGRFGRVALRGEGASVRGIFSAGPGVSLFGTADENRLVFELKGDGATARGVLRAALGGQFLAGLVWRDGGGPTNFELCHRDEHTSRLVAETLAASDPPRWGRMAGVLKSLGREVEAVLLYERVVEAAGEYRRRAVAYSDEWQFYFSHEWGSLLQQMNTQQARQTRLSGLAPRLRPDEKVSASPFAKLLSAFGRAVGLQSELNALARKVKEQHGAAPPDFGARLAGQIELWRRSLSDEASRMEALETSQSQLAALLGVLAAAGSYEQALVVSETARARAYSDLLQQRIYAAQARAAFAGLAPGDVEKFVADKLAASAPVELEELKQTARGRRATFVEYFLDETDLYTWVVSPEGQVNFRHHRQQNLRRTLADFVAAARASLGMRSREAVMKSAPQPPERFLPLLTELHRLLVAPLKEWLPRGECEPLVFIPHGPLFMLPFAALHDGEKYLVERHTVSVAPSLRFVETVHRMAASRPTPPPGMLVVGDPLMPSLRAADGTTSEPLPPLVFARLEAEQVAKKLGTDALVGAAAGVRKVRALLPAQRLVHLATHGLLDEDGPPADMPGAVALAPEGGDDGFLTAREIAALDLRARLVVISACNTGRGRLSTDGISGLTRAFLTAGAECVVASLWAVADHSTRELMVEFYEHLRRGLPVAPAMRRAMLVVKANPRFDNPLYWAAFSVTGQTQTPLFADSTDEGRRTRKGVN
jgi:CHAT domain-containing protein